MKLSQSDADKVGRIAVILGGLKLGDRVWASSTMAGGQEIEGPGTIVESRTHNRNPPFPYHGGVGTMGASILVRYDAEPHDSGANNGHWTAAWRIRPL
jgi:hypothetical protein